MVKEQLTKSHCPVMEVRERERCIATNLDDADWKCFSGVIENRAREHSNPERELSIEGVSFFKVHKNADKKKRSTLWREEETGSNSAGDIEQAKRHAIWHWIAHCESNALAVGCHSIGCYLSPESAALQANCGRRYAPQSMAANALLRGTQCDQGWG